jgi:glutamate dehydrogenase
VTERFAASVAAVRRGLPSWLLGAEAEAYAQKAKRLEAAGAPADMAADAAAAGLLPQAMDIAVVAERTGAPIALAGKVLQYVGERLGLVPLRELVLALPRDRRWNSMARASLRDDLSTEQAALTADVLARRSGDSDKPEKLVRSWVDSWDSSQRRAAAQLADIANGERQELAELLVAVRTLRGLRPRT